MRATYRLGSPLSYTIATFALAVTLAGCAEERADPPRALIVAAHAPQGWATPRARRPGDAPEIVALRFSSLDVPLGSRWTGEIVASTNVSAVELRTNLWAFAAERTAPGRFRFAQNVMDLPAFLVRPYTLHVVARTAAGAETVERIPIRMDGRLRAMMPARNSV